eukprot:7338291-Prymnesium_polylepis.1
MAPRARCTRSDRRRPAARAPQAARHHRRPLPTTSAIAGPASSSRARTRPPATCPCSGPSIGAVFLADALVGVEGSGEEEVVRAHRRVLRVVRVRVEHG